MYIHISTSVIRIISIARLAPNGQFFVTRNWFLMSEANASGFVGEQVPETPLT